MEPLSSRTADVALSPDSKPRRLPSSKSSSFVNHHYVPASSTLVNSASRDSGHHEAIESNMAWTSSSGDVGFLSDGGEFDNRDMFVKEYNRLSKKVCHHGDCVYC